MCKVAPLLDPKAPSPSVVGRDRGADPVPTQQSSFRFIRRTGQPRMPSQYGRDCSSVYRERSMGRLAVWAQFVSLVVVGLVAGIFVATQIGQLRVQNTLDARGFVLVKREFEVAVGRVMPVLTVAAGVSIIPVVILAGSRWVRGIAIVALVLWIGVVAVTLVFNAPVNAAAATWDPASPPLDWEAQRNRWHLGQTLRTPLAVLSFVAVVLASLWERLWP